MANIKFSAFATETNSANVDFLVGYQGTTMKKIAPGNLGGYPYLIDTASLYSGFVPTGLSGNPQGNTILGIDAGAGLTTGQRNTFIGNLAGNAQTNASSAVAIGHDAALASNSNSYVAIGVNANRGGNSDNCVIIGEGAAYNGSSSDSVIIGQAAGNSSGGFETVLIGRFAGAFGGAAAKQIAIGGGQVGRSNTAQSHMDVGYAAGYSNTTGTGNTNIGYQAGYSNTTNSNRTIIGYQAGTFSTGGFNTFLGYRVGYGSSGSTTGERNVAIGDISLTALTNGFRNVSIGTNSGQAITSGNNNVLIGDFAGSSITSGANNVCVGQNAQPSSGTVSNQITLGNASITALRIPGLQSSASDGDVLTFSSGTGLITLQAAGGGGATDLNGLSDCLVDTDSLYVGEVPAGLSGNPQSNTILGIDAANALTTGTSNTYIGNDAGLNATTQSFNTAVGKWALRDGGGTSSSENVAIGYRAGEQCGGSTSSNNTIVGTSAARGSTSMTRSTHIGYKAGRFNASNDTCTLGYFALYGNNCANAVAIGRSAATNASATGHISIGWQAGNSQTSGSENTNLGYEAGYTNTTGNRNVNIGWQAGRANVGSDGVLIGYKAGLTVASSLNRSTMVGSYAGESVGASRFSNTFIGYESGRYYNSNINCFVGSGTGRGNTSGATGALNTAIGGACFENSTTASRFIAIGYQCLKNGVNTGSGVVAIGANIHTSDTLTGSNNVIIGDGASLSAVGVSNEVNLYNGSVVARFQGAASAWSFVSDERDKKDIEDLELGLDFVSKLKPRKFKWDIRGKEENKNKEASGFIAQEVKQTLEEIGASYTGIVDDNNPEQLTLAQANIIPMLVKSIQELKAEIELLKSQK